MPETMAQLRDPFLSDLHAFCGTRDVAEAVATVVRWAQDEITADVLAGNVPRTVASFADLHAHTDANLYGSADLWPGLLLSEQPEGYAGAFCRFWNDVQDEVDHWIKGGALLSL
jgi:hypothetical protein